MVGKLQPRINKWDIEIVVLMSNNNNNQMDQSLIMKSNQMEKNY